MLTCVEIRFSYEYYFTLKDYCHTIVLGTQFAASSHFIWGITIKNIFVIRLITKQSLTNILLFCLILTGIELNKVFLTLF